MTTTTATRVRKTAECITAGILAERSPDHPDVDLLHGRCLPGLVELPNAQPGEPLLETIVCYCVCHRKKMSG